MFERVTLRTDLQETWLAIRFQHPQSALTYANSAKNPAIV